MRDRKLQNKPFTELESSKVIKGILKAISHITRFNMIHRDIKPSNIVIEDPEDLETVKLLDFGLSLHCQTCVPNLEEFCGTIVYMAPEQVLQ